jgi:hypothetical protein
MFFGPIMCFPVFKPVFCPPPPPPPPPVFYPPVCAPVFHPPVFHPPVCGPIYPPVCGPVIVGCDPHLPPSTAVFY